MAGRPCCDPKDQAVLVKTAEVLEARLPEAELSVVLDPHAPDIQDSSSLEVVLGSGHAFRLHVQHDRERTLLETMIEDADTPSEKLRTIAQDAYDLHYRRYTAAPRHHGAVVTLHHMYPSFASAGRLLKRWVASHMLSSQLPEEMLELIMASVYLDPGAHEVPTTAHTGFVRAIELIAHWSWQETALFVPIYTATRDHDQDASVRSVAFPEGKRRQAEASFQAVRKMDKEFVKSTLVVVTEEDLLGRAWLPMGLPHRLIASRLVTLAQATLAAIKVPTVDIQVRRRDPAQTFTNRLIP
jgi:U3 small nucleolar RNA-associated protein 22